MKSIPKPPQRLGLSLGLPTAQNRAALKLGGVGKLGLGVSKQDEEPDPFAGIIYQDKFADDAKAELGALKSAFQQRQEREATRQREATDSEFWVALCFQTREQKELFLARTGWLQEGDKYIDGQFVAKKLGIELPKYNITFADKIDKKLAQISNLADGRRRGGKSD